MENSTMVNNGEFAKMVLNKLDKHDDILMDIVKELGKIREYEAIRDSSTRDQIVEQIRVTREDDTKLFVTMKEDIKELKVKSGLWGTVGGALVGFLIWAVKQLMLTPQ